MVSKQSELHNHEGSWVLAQPPVGEGFDIGLDAKGHWTRTRVTKKPLEMARFWMKHFRLDISAGESNSP
ncbi:unnamed protein product [Ilex paraguariensis]|uniref:Uncharacterized protein n=1 Tax=Ilex paraguariensis TaxID=185542 RepID=A0ABC8T2D9_9AQUA